MDGRSCSKLASSRGHDVAAARVVVHSWLAVRLEVLEVILGAEVRARRLVARHDIVAVIVCKIHTIMFLLSCAKIK
jgi:hypothetical protein